jgi:DNA-binding MarR family transcriptional regulator
MIKMQKSNTIQPSKTNINTDVQAQRMVLSSRQMKILRFIDARGLTILEEAYVALKIPKPTTGYHLQRLENFGLVEEVENIKRGRKKPVRLTTLGKAVVKHANGEPISDDFRLKLTALELVVSLGLKTLNKGELEQVIKLFEEHLQQRGTSNKSQPKMIV